MKNKNKKNGNALSEQCRLFFFFQFLLLVNIFLVEVDVTNKTYDDKSESTKSVSVDITKVRKCADSEWIAKHTNNHQDCAQHNCDKS